MGKPFRPTSAEVVSHVLNRANACRALIEGDRDYAAFGGVLAEAGERFSMRLLGLLWYA